MPENRDDDAKADGDGGEGDEKYEINSMGEPVRTGTTRNGCDTVATYETISPAENHRE